jgi:hypothetical protein
VKYGGFVCSDDVDADVKLMDEEEKQTIERRTATKGGSPRC